MWHGPKICKFLKKRGVAAEKIEGVRQRASQSNGNDVVGDNHLEHVIGDYELAQDFRHTATARDLSLQEIS